MLVMGGVLCYKRASRILFDLGEYADVIGD
jgi:hypothetical protein